MPPSLQYVLRTKEWSSDQGTVSMGWLSVASQTNTLWAQSFEAHSYKILLEVRV